MSIRSYGDLIRTAREDNRTLVAVDRPASDRALVTLQDPDTLNALSAPMMVQLVARLEELSDDPELRTVVLTGAPPAFSAGGDIRLMQFATEHMAAADVEGATAPWRFIRRQFGAVVRLIANSHVVFVAAVNGAAAGVGLAFALACDRTIASEQASIVPAFGALGLVPEVGTSWLLTRRLGYQRALEYYLSGDPLDPETAMELGLVAEVVPHDELRAAADTWCDRVAAQPPHAVEMTKTLLRSAVDLRWEESVVMEEFAQPLCFTTGPFREAVDAFLAVSDNDAER